MPERTCSIEGCSGPVKARGWCNLHYSRWYQANQGQCSVDGCEKPAKATGLCGMHYWRQQSRGDLGAAEMERSPKGMRPPCSVDGCERQSKGLGFCNTHYERWRRTGDVAGDREVQGYRLYLQTCNMDECERPQASSYGLCELHVTRYRVWGDPYYNDLGRGPENHMWLGDNIGYAAAHSRVRRLYGSPSEHECCDCGGPAADWAYDHTDPDEKFTTQGWPYSTDISTYVPLCKKCHVAFDLAL